MARSSELVGHTALHGQAQTPPEGEEGNVWEGARKTKEGETKRKEHSHTSWPPTALYPKIFSKKWLHNLPEKRKVTRPAGSYP